MIELLLAAAILTANTDEGRRVTITVRERRVTRVRGTVERYECDEFGDVGPIRFDVRPRARVDRRRRFSFVAGERAQRIGIAGYVRRRSARGRIRIAGTIATGQRCQSPTIRYR